MSDVQGEPLKGTALYNAILERFRAVPDAEGRLDCEKLADAALQISAVYELVFGSGFISRHLKQDIANSSGRMREAAKALRKSRGGSAVTADELIAWELKELGIPKMRKDQNSGVRGMLWMKRALDFVFSLICNTFGTMKDATVKECALDAYDRVLKPYHSFLVSNIVSLAFSLAPSKEEFVRRLGFEMDEAENCLGSIQEVVLPVIARLNTLLEEANCNFPDKA
ncbi:glycolipid transfer protein, putative [Eimeria necatrix]|uniref:Glycolipid transfer protein, putative n=1 Tax=Eimeria necatrix TaxID=51315 RepID=U6MMX5_9EIME|nr:glycolipid transfer protein, putative [Eimeria necatrix]CDJ63819.1 glycolipid transfer protein, putative [Eimeria necatrix]